VASLASAGAWLRGHLALSAGPPRELLEAARRLRLDLRRLSPACPQRRGRAPDRGVAACPRGRRTPWQRGPSATREERAALTAPLLTARQVAERLSVSPAAVLRWAARGEVPSFKLPGGAVRFDPDALDEWLRGCAERASDGNEVCHDHEPPPARPAGYETPLRSDSSRPRAVPPGAERGRIE
jgi:excisionase family DNA binding protein